MRVSAVLVALAALPGAALGQQVPDTLFRPAVGSPAYRAGSGPVVLLDEGHHDFHTLDGRYLPFGRLLEADGYSVRPLRSRFTAASLAPAKVLVIANAIAAENETRWSLPTPSAFDPAEIEAIARWVEGGGAVLLIADHMPFGGAAEALAARLGARFSNGFAMDSAAMKGLIRYRRSDGSLGSHPITSGRSPGERVDSITSFTGQAFELTRPGTALMTVPAGVVLWLPSEAWKFAKDTPRRPAGGLLQGAVLEMGRGRVALFGEAAMFSAQLGGPRQIPMGMNSPQAPQNGQFVLNVLHWLTRLEP